MTAWITRIGVLLNKMDDYQRAHRRAGFSYAVFKKYSEDETGHRAALMAYYGFLSLFPLLLVLTTLLKLLIRDDSQLRDQIIQSAVTYFPIIGRDLQQNIHGLGKTGAALVAGILVTLFGARGVADVLRSGLDHIWQVPYARRTGFPGSLFKSMSIIVVGGIGLVLAPIVAGYVLAFGHDGFSQSLSIILTLIVLFAVMVFVIKVGLSVTRPFRDIWVGAAVAAIGLDVLQGLGGYILTRELRNLDSLYGTFAIVIGLLFWIYLQTQMLLYAFELDSVRVLKLWPRSLSRPLTPADHRAFTLYADRARFHELEENDIDT